jgi:hypothetical protein
LLEGPCRYVQLDDGGFTIGTTIFDANLEYFAYVAREDGGYAGYWNGESGAFEAKTPLGPLVSRGSCWVGETVRICAWR